MSDYAREYQRDCDALARMSFHEFMWLLQGLSKHSRFMRAWADKPKTLHDPADRAAVIAAARR